MIFRPGQFLSRSWLRSACAFFGFLVQNLTLLKQVSGFHAVCHGQRDQRADRRAKVYFGSERHWQVIQCAAVCCEIGARGRSGARLGLCSFCAAKAGLKAGPRAPTVICAPSGEEGLHIRATSTLVSPQRAGLLHGTGWRTVHVVAPAQRVRRAPPPLHRTFPGSCTGATGRKALLLRGIRAQFRDNRI